MRGSTIYVGFVMDAIPHDLVIQPSCDTPANSEGQFAIKGLLQQLKHFLSLGSIGKIGSSSCTRVGFAITVPIGEAIVYDDGALVVALAHRIFVYRHSHLSLGLVSSHMPENSRADGTLRPVLFPDELDETVAVILVRAAQHQNILIPMLGQLLLDVSDDELFETDHAFLLLHLAACQRELQCGEVANLKDIMVLLHFLAILLVDEWHQELDGFEKRVV